MDALDQGRGAVADTDESDADRAPGGARSSRAHTSSLARQALSGKRLPAPTSPPPAKVAFNIAEVASTTITDVARAAGVSIATVSRVLSPGPVPHPVRAETADRVRAAARQLNFIPSPLARGLAARRSGLIGLIVPDLSDPHYPQIAIAVEDRARDAELAVLICNTLGEIERMAEYLQLLQARRVDAIVLSGATSLNAVELLALQRCEVPLVLIGRPAVHIEWPNVSIDNRQGARLATRHLIQIGRERIVHLSGP
ncbi:MAG: LacI family transcriptional regulator, partial [Chloroflexi bacterium]